MSTKKLVAVFVGGTSGVGQGMAEVFNRHTKGNSHIVLVGRNRDAAESIISNMKAAVAQESNTRSYEFVPCDVSVMSNVKDSASSILAKHTKINYLILSPGVMSTNHILTEEGIDKKLAVHYYGRWTFIHGLLPALRSAKDASEDAKVMTILNPSSHTGKINLDDLGLKKDYSISGAAVAGCLYNNVMCEEYAIRNPGIVFAHADPGAVRTNLLKSSDVFWFRVANFFYPLIYPFTVTKDQCGEYLWSGLYRCAPSGAGSGVPGAYRIGSKGEDLGSKGTVLTSEEREAVWKHTLEETKTIDD